MLDIKKILFSNKSDSEGYILLDDNKSKSEKNKYIKIRNGCFIVISILSVVLFGGFIVNIIACLQKRDLLSAVKESQNRNLRGDITLSDMGLDGFEFVDPKNTDGPITINRKKDDGKKRVLKDLILDNNEKNFESFYYDYESYDNLDTILKKDDEYLCEVGEPSEFRGYNVSCPKHYTIEIDEAFYGRYAFDTTRCPTRNKKKVQFKNLLTKTKCGKDSTKIVKELCEGEKECTIKPSYTYFSAPCPTIHKYLHVKYHCKKNEELKKPKIAVVMFANKIVPNTVYENSVSEFYQYCKIHGYKFIFNNDRYDTIRNIFYMKLHVLNEAIVRGLKTNEYDWIFWADSDVMITNPNIKLETFIPTDDNVNFIAATDRHGLNAGAFMLRVHPWTLDYIDRAISFAYYYKKKLKYADQTSLNNVLVMDKEHSHYVVVPQHWFNNYPGMIQPGDFLAHFAGFKDKSLGIKKTNERLKTFDNHFASQTNESLRKEVLEYYENQKKNKTYLKKQA